jgi:hypothetical protein
MTNSIQTKNKYRYSAGMPMIKKGLFAKDKTGNVSNTAKRMLVKMDMSRTFLVTVKVKKIDS